MNKKIFLGKSGKLNRKQVKGAIELFEKNGFSISKIAKIQGVNRGLMERVLAGNGVLELSKSSVIDEDMIQQSDILYNIGKMSLAAIGEKLGVSRWTVKKALHLGSIKTRREMNKGVHKKNRRKYSILDEDLRQSIVEDYVDGMSGLQVADKYHVSQARVYVLLSERDVLMRSRGRYKKVAK